jgi:hypothetical protein
MEGRVVTAPIVRFPPRRLAAVWILPLAESGWLLLVAHGWLHGSYSAALEDTEWLAQFSGLQIRQGARA